MLKSAIDQVWPTSTSQLLSRRASISSILHSAHDNPKPWFATRSVSTWNPGPNKPWRRPILVTAPLKWTSIFLCIVYEDYAILPSNYWLTCAWQEMRTAEHEVGGMYPFQVLLASKPVLDLNLTLASRDMFGSHLTLALPSECHQRPHVHRLLISYLDRGVLQSLPFKLCTWSIYFQACYVVYV